MSARATLKRLALEAAIEPSTAPDRVRQMISVLEHYQDESALPEAYPYAGARRLVVQLRDLAVEALPTDEPGSLELWQTGNRAVDLRIPRDCWVIGVAGQVDVQDATPRGQTPAYALANLANSRNALALAAVGWQLDGARSYQTDGYDRQVGPACNVVGTARRPRPMAWALNAGQRINVVARNLANVVGGFDAAVDVWPLIDVEIAFYAVDRGQR